MRYSYYSIVVTIVYQKLDVSGLFSSKCRHVDREEKRIVQRTGADPGFLKGGGGGGLIIKKLYSKSVHGALIKFHFRSSRNDASLCAHKLIQV